MRFFLLFILSLCFFGQSALSNTNQSNFSFDLLKEYEKFTPVVVMGSGPAGLTAAYYIARARIPVTLFTGKDVGGQLMGTTEVENWPGLPKTAGSKIIDNLFEQNKEFGTAIVYDSIEVLDFSTQPFITLTTSSGDTIRTLSLVIATGASPRKLGIDGELDYWGSGVSVCAVCDSRFYKDKRVAIVGGGDAAIEEALQLAAYAKEITILVRSQKMRAVRSMQDKLVDYPQIKIVYNKSVTKIIGNNEHVTGIELIDNETGENSSMSLEGVFLAIGHSPTTHLFEESLKLSLDGYILVDPLTQQTSQEGVFAAGDAVDSRYRQAGVAAGDGIKIAFNVLSYLTEIGFTEPIARRFTRTYFGY